MPNSRSPEGIQTKKQFETKQGRVRGYVALMEEMHKVQTTDVEAQALMKDVLRMAKEIPVFTISDAKGPDGQKKLEEHEEKCLALAEKFFELQTVLKNSGHTEEGPKVLAEVFNNYLLTVVPGVDVVNRVNKLDSIIETYNKFATGTLGMLGLCALKSATTIGVGCCAALPRDTPENKCIANIANGVAKAADGMAQNATDLSVKGLSQAISKGATEVITTAIKNATPELANMAIKQVRRN